MGRRLTVPDHAVHLTAVGPTIASGDGPVSSDHMCDPTKLAERAARWFAEYSAPYLAEPVESHLGIRAWFADTVIPLIERDFSNLAAEMSIVVESSFAYGHFDQYSDLEAVLSCRTVRRP